MDVDSLAFFGGEPKFNVKLHVGRPNIIYREKFINRVNQILDNKWLTNNGPFVREFEEKIARYTGAKHCITTCNGTSALEITIKALGLSGEVILPSFTYIATAHALKWFGITPVFADVDAYTHNIDPEKVIHLINSQTTGIIGVHLWGRPCPIDDLVNIAKNHKLKLIFDAAHAFGCSYKDNTMIGNFGDAEIFSFHATKFVHSLEGGAVTTNNDELAETLSQMKDFGYTKSDEIVSVGTNAKMNEISAAMGLTMLEGLDEIKKVNYSNYKKYQRELSGIPGIKLISFDESERSNFQYIVISIDAFLAGIDLDQIQIILQAENILARKYFAPGCHRTRPYYEDFKSSGRSLPVTNQLSEQLLCLPNGMAIGDEEITKICEIIRFLIINSLSVKQRLKSHSMNTYN